MDRFVRDGIFVVDTHDELTRLMFNSINTQNKWINFLNKKIVEQSCILEIEDTNGKRILTLQLTLEEDNSITISNLQGNGSIAEITVDDIYGTDYYKVRLQLD